MINKKEISVLFFPSEYYPTTRVRITELYMKEFTKFGNKITWVLLSEEKKSQFEKIKNGYNTLLIIPSRGRQKINDKLINIFLKYSKYWKGKKQIESGNVDIIIANDGIIEGFIGYFLSKKYKIPFVFFLSSLFFDMTKHEFIADKSVVKFFKCVGGYIKKPLFIFLIKRCDIFHPISQKMDEYFNPYLNQNTRTIPLPLCPSISFLNNSNPKLRMKKDYFSLIYVGQILPMRRIDFLIDIVRDIKIQEPNIQVRLLVVGPIFGHNYRKFLEKKTSSFGLEKCIKIIDEVPISQVPDFIQSSDIGLSLLPPILSYKVSSPTKVVEYLSLGIPVIGNEEIQDQKDVIEMSGGGLVTKYEITEVVEKILYLLKNKNKIIEMGNKGRQWINKNRKYSFYAKVLQKKYNELIKNNV